MNRYYLLLIFSLLFLLIRCTDPWDEHTREVEGENQMNIAEFVASKGEYSLFYELLKSTSLLQKLEGAALYTIWIPTNEAMASVPGEIIDNDDKKERFVRNHIAYGAFSAKNRQDADSVYMFSGKKLFYQPGLGLIDGVDITVERELKLKNGFLQEVESVILPRTTIWDWVLTEAEENQFIRYLRSLDFMYFDAEASGFLGRDDNGNPVYRDSVVYVQNQFLMQVADLDAEDSLLTLLVPSDEVFNAHFDQFNRYFRLDDKESNPAPTARDSAQIWINVAKDFVFGRAYDLASIPDTLVSFFDVKVPINKTAVTMSKKLSNGYMHMISECAIKSEHKVLPVIMNGEECTVLFNGSADYYFPFFHMTGGGLDGLYFRQRENTYGGYDVIQDNHANSGVHSGLVLRGPLLNSVKYRVKLRASNDFATSPRWADESRDLRQYIAPVTVLRDLKTRVFTGLSPNSNKLRSTAGFGTADVEYNPEDESSYYVEISKEAYSENPLSDEVDLGYYDYRYMEYAFFRIIPFEAKMAVVVDYLRLVPVLE